MEENLGVWKVGEGRYEIRLHMFGTQGKGLCGMLCGGEREHVGGTAYAVPRQKSSGDGITADVSIICGPGHKDVYAAQKVAEKICIEAGETTCITAGIHIDKATDDELKLLRDNCMAAAADFLNEYAKKVK